MVESNWLNLFNFQMFKSEELSNEYKGIFKQGLQI